MNALIRRQIIDRMEQLPTEVQSEFKSLPKLLVTFPLEVATGYVLSRLERTRRFMIFAKLIRQYRAESTMTASVIQRQSMEESQFAIFSQRILSYPVDYLPKFSPIQKLHRKAVFGSEIKHEETVHAFVKFFDSVHWMYSHCTVPGYRPFGDRSRLKPFKQQVSKATTRWLLKGFGFSVS